MDDFAEAIAKITIEGMSSRGTGFLVAPDMVATALHVVADRKAEPPTFYRGKIHLKFRGGHETDAEVIHGKYNQDADCVLLRCVNPGSPPDCPTIPLRQLDHSDDLLKMRGYPDAQPVDGMTWAGQVRDHAAELTNSYASGSRAYAPVLQLFSNEAGAGSGAPPRGMSGAPVIVGTAAVGLVRWALMHDGSTVAGTLYACSAKDIVALDPAQLGLRPPLPPVVTLNPEQIAQVEQLLVSAFGSDLNGLHRAIRFSLGAEAERSVPSAADLPDFVLKLVPGLMQQGKGMISVLLRAVITARPQDENVRVFCEQVSPYSLQPLDDEDLVQQEHDDKLISEIILALIALNGLPRGRGLRSIIAPYRSNFNETREQIGLLARYKQLHNCLHAVEKQQVQIINNVNRYSSVSGQPHLLRNLREDARFLQEQADNARKQLGHLPTASAEREWIDILASCATDMRAASMVTASIAEREKVPDVPEHLARILPAALDINEEIVKAAKDVRLDNIAEALRLVEQHLDKTMDQNFLTGIGQGSFAISRLRSRLAGLVAEHDEWQSLNTELDYAKNSTKHQPQGRFATWVKFKDKLLGLCNTFPQEKWSVELKRIMAPWMPDVSPPEPKIPSSIEQLDDEFQDFYDECIRRFIRVDDELYALCGKLTRFKEPLDALEESAR